MTLLLLSSGGQHIVEASSTFHNRRRAVLPPVVGGEAGHRLHVRFGRASGERPRIVPLVCLQKRHELQMLCTSPSLESFYLPRASFILLPTTIASPALTWSGSDGGMSRAPHVPLSHHVHLSERTQDCIIKERSRQALDNKDDVLHDTSVT